ncbi:TatA/E family twin arginine-targeting protein translocase [Euhalothece natronophila Z-M001]|uniref:Sec-independent protein translocase protein TatA n=1 Tax=Euhalothece natronophila Z-M001 TaxID=522448 RepID=A0A5B8NPH2_9CHRO|nr:TatA/E family twin arginine-targeting protein translocase [Euhalothece natronophila]QDZ41192.1 TatA/E family twin arginine-targeting protein translocase [Euhalothece natronophila Z-M001]
MNVFGIGLPEMALIFVIALLIFGPKKLPEIGSSLGKAIRGFQDASREFENEFKRETSKAQKSESVKMNAQLEPSESEAETVSQADTTSEKASSEKEQSQVNS